MTADTLFIRRRLDYRHDSRHRNFMFNLLPVLNVLGRLMSVFSLTYLLPIIGSLAYGDGLVADYVYAMALTALPGGLLFLVPETMMPVWPWDLTPLTSRAPDDTYTAFPSRDQPSSSSGASSHVTRATVPVANVST